MSLMDKNIIVFRHIETGEEVWVADKLQIEYMRGLENNPNVSDNKFKEIGTLDEVKSVQSKKAKKAESTEDTVSKEK